MACAVTNIKKKIQRFIIYLIISILMLIQNFITIDPITLKSFKNLSIGNGTIITTRTFGREANGDLTTDETIWSENEMTHAASYNRQYTYFGDLFEKFLRQIEYTDTTLIAVAPTYGEYMTKLALFGKWDPQAQYFYDPMSGHLVLDETKTLLNLQVIENSSQIDFDSYEEVYLVYFPFREQYYKIDSLISEFEVLDTISTNYRQWKMYGYKLK